MEPEVLPVCSWFQDELRDSAPILLVSACWQGSWRLEIEPSVGKPKSGYVGLGFPKQIHSRDTVPCALLFQREGYQQLDGDWLKVSTQFLLYWMSSLLCLASVLGASVCVGTSRGWLWKGDGTFGGGSFISSGRTQLFWTTSWSGHLVSIPHTVHRQGPTSLLQSTSSQVLGFCPSSLRPQHRKLGTETRKLCLMCFDHKAWLRPQEQWHILTGIWIYRCVNVLLEMIRSKILKGYIMVRGTCLHVCIWLRTYFWAHNHEYMGTIFDDGRVMAVYVWMLNVFCLSVWGYGRTHPHILNRPFPRSRANKTPKNVFLFNFSNAKQLYCSWSKSLHNWKEIKAGLWDDFWYIWHTHPV